MAAKSKKQKSINDLKMGFKLAIILGILLFASVAGSASYIKYLSAKQLRIREKRGFTASRDT